MNQSKEINYSSNLKGLRKRSSSSILFKTELLLLVIVLIITLLGSGLNFLISILEKNSSIPVIYRGFPYYFLDCIADLSGIVLVFAPFIRVTSTVPYLMKFNVSRKKIQRSVILYSIIQTFVLILLKFFSEKMLLEINPDYITKGDTLIISLISGFFMMALVIFSSTLLIKMKLTLYSGASVILTLCGMLFMGCFLFAFVIFKTFITGVAFYFSSVLILLLLGISAKMLLRIESAN